jgi:hypothetical protein
MYCVLFIPALREIEPAFPVLQNHLAEMAVPASTNRVGAVWCV